MKDWSIVDGVIYGVGTNQGSHIRTVRQWRDFDLELEYKVENNSNGGVYLKGLAEIQVCSRRDHNSTSKGQDGAIFAQRAPDSLVSKPAGQWNQLRVVWKGRIVSVYLNDYMIHNQVQINKPTEGHIKGSLTGQGPIMLQALRGIVWYRNIKVRPAR